MGFSDKFDNVLSILQDIYYVKLNPDDYDGFMVKNMAASNCLNKEISSKQTHIAITGNQMDLFPYIYSKKYLEEKDETSKNYFVLKAPINIFKSNCDKILSGFIDFGNEKSLKEYMCIYPRKDGEQVQLSMKTNGDSENFIKFRELIKPNDYFVVLKKMVC